MMVSSHKSGVDGQARETERGPMFSPLTETIGSLTDAVSVTQNYHKRQFGRVAPHFWPLADPSHLR